MSAQLLFPFIEKTEIDYLRDELAEVKIEAKEAVSVSHNVRKGIFKRHSDLAKLFVSQQAEIDLLKAQMEIMKKAMK